MAGLTTAAVAATVRAPLGAAPLLLDGVMRSAAICAVLTARNAAAGMALERGQGRSEAAESALTPQAAAARIDRQSVGRCAHLQGDQCSGPPSQLRCGMHSNFRRRSRPADTQTRRSVRPEAVRLSFGSRPQPGFLRFFPHLSRCCGWPHISEHASESLDVHGDCSGAGSGGRGSGGTATYLRRRRRRAQPARRLGPG